MNVVSDLFSFSVSPLQPLRWPALAGFDQLYVKRDDLLHPQISGNKFRKLKWLLQSPEPVLSMGGAFSNHLHALAYACSHLGIPCAAFVRGEALDTPTLNDCRHWGMQLIPVSRMQFRALREEADKWRELFQPEYANHRADWRWLPEGGRSELAVQGVAELIDELPFVPDVLLSAAATGTTAAGLIQGLKGRGFYRGIAVLKSGAALQQSVQELLPLDLAWQNWHIDTEYHQGGYAKVTPELMHFCTAFEKETGIVVEPVYTGKVFHALPQLAAQGLLQPSQKIVVVHTGGVQGRRGFNDVMSVNNRNGS